MKSGPLVLKSMLKKLEKNCSRHGVYTSLSLVEGNWTGCPDCEEQARAHEQAGELLENRRRLISAQIKESGVPPRFINATLDNFSTKNPVQQNVLSAAVKYAQNFSKYLAQGRCLAFVGPPGTGKTHLAVGILREIIIGGHSAIMTTVGDYVREIKDYCWSRTHQLTESAVIAKYRAADFLILDEVGVQFGSRTEENLIFTLINKRYEDLKSTLVISNELEEGLEMYLGDRTFDRLKDGGGLIVPFPWESYRGTAVGQGASI